MTSLSCSRPDSKIEFEGGRRKGRLRQQHAVTFNVFSSRNSVSKKALSWLRLHAKICYANAINSPYHSNDPSKKSMILIPCWECSAVDNLKRFHTISWEAHPPTTPLHNSRSTNAVSSSPCILPPIHQPPSNPRTPHLSRMELAMPSNSSSIAGAAGTSSRTSSMVLRRRSMPLAT
jgi:hypothetical protein